MTYYGYMNKEVGQLVGLQVRKARKGMAPGDMKVVELPDGQRPLTVRIATPKELARIKKTAPRAPSDPPKRPVVKFR